MLFFLKLENILNEAFENFSVFVIIKTKKEASVVEIFDRIRAIEFVTIVRAIEDPRVERINDASGNYSLIKMKFLAGMSMKDTISYIKKKALQIDGLMKFYIRTNTINPVT